MMPMARPSNTISVDIRFIGARSLDQILGPDKRNLCCRERVAKGQRRPDPEQRSAEFIPLHRADERGLPRYPLQPIRELNRNKFLPPLLIASTHCAARMP